mmetsp:Transcript_6059/g.9749  ORF Transcript_6059/g.9749 Transcript_6059/m.9749 type:complete len:128 (+) Transcript_6059:347-730(+)
MTIVNLKNCLNGDKGARRLVDRQAGTCSKTRELEDDTTHLKFKDEGLLAGRGTPRAAANTCVYLLESGWKDVAEDTEDSRQSQPRRGKRSVLVPVRDRRSLSHRHQPEKDAGSQSPHRTVEPRRSSR